MTPEQRAEARNLLILLVAAAERDVCAGHPAYLIDRMTAVDEREAEDDREESVFRFDVLSAEERRAANERTGLIRCFGGDEAGWPAGLGWRAPSPPSKRTGRTWNWQRSVLEEWLGCTRWIGLKARQLGITWLSAALTGWTALYRPGSRCLHYRQKEDDVQDNIRMTWQLMRSLPQHLWNRQKVRVPDMGRTAQPTTLISMQSPDGRMTTVQGMTSAVDSGHGKRAALVVLDEYSRIEAAGSIMKAANSAAGSKGRVLVISTANGVSNPETGEGNRYHWLWVNAEARGYVRRFLPWSLHPERDQDWYDTDPEVLGLKTHEKAEQYPANEHEAFTLTNATFFDPDDLIHYARQVKEPLYRFDFVDPDNPARLARGRTAKVHRYVKPIDLPRVKPNYPNGNIAVYAEPVEGHRYAIGADVASGHGNDYSVCYVVDLATMDLAAEFRAKVDEDLYAAQLHYLGRRYGTADADDEDGDGRGFALLAIETQGGYGNAVIAALRDRTQGRPVYGNLHRNVLDNRAGFERVKPFGYPMNSANRPKTFNQLDQALRERTLPWVTARLLEEMQTFVHYEKGTSPAAQQGSNDDCVMACAIALEMYRQKGEHPEKRVSKPRKRRIRAGIGRRKPVSTVDQSRYPS